MILLLLLRRILRRRCGRRRWRRRPSISVPNTWNGTLICTSLVMETTVPSGRITHTLPLLAAATAAIVVPLRRPPKTYPNIFVCQPVPHGEVASMSVNCVAELRDVLRVTLQEQQRQEQEQRLQQQLGVDDGPVLAQPIPIPSYDIIVIAIGIWQDVRPWDCRLPPNETITTLIEDSMRLLTKIITLDRRNRRRQDTTASNNNNDGMRVIWRTGGWKHGMEQEKHLATLEMNQAIMDFMDAAHREYDQEHPG
jgi:hypothetical protein